MFYIILIIVIILLLLFKIIEIYLFKAFLLNIAEIFSLEIPKLDF